MCLVERGCLSLIVFGRVADGRWSDAISIEPIWDLQASTIRMYLYLCGKRPRGRPGGLMALHSVADDDGAELVSR